jgi:hypothetical protein
VASDLKGVVAARPLITSSTGIGALRHGFTIRLAKGVWIYGHTDGGKLTILAAHLDNGAENMALTTAFLALSKTHSLILVDWQSQMVLTGVTFEGQITAWRPPT